MNNKTQRTLSPAYKNAIKVIGDLEEEGFQAKLAGGCVRDRLLGLDPKDFDVATTALPEEVIKIFTKKQIQTVPTGIAHGTVTVVMNGSNVEVTTLRIDAETFGRKAKVEFGNLSFEEDAARRDFTINALYEDRNGQIDDYFGGQKDLKNMLLRFVGEPADRIKEDYLRILRYYRFWARYQFKVDPKAKAAVAKLKSGLEGVSQERITAEILELLSYKDIGPQIKEMAANGILALILPESKYNTKTAQCLKACVRIVQKDRAIARLSLLYAGEGTHEEIERIAKHLKLSNHQIEVWQRLIASCAEVKQLGVPETEVADIMQLIDDCERAAGEESLMTLFVPYWKIFFGSNKDFINKVLKTETKKKALRKAALPVNGQDIMESAGISAGPQVGIILENLKRIYRNGKWKTRSQGLALAKTLHIKNNK